MRCVALMTALLLTASPISALAETQTLTVQSLMIDGYTVAGVVTSAIGPGVFLQKANSLLVCFVAETPGSPTVATQYCKPVK
jgi:hypothetical protein